MKKTFTMMLLCCNTIVVNAQLKNYNADGKVPIIGERTYLKIDKQQESIDVPTQSFVAAAAAILPALIDYGVALGKHISKKNIESFTGTYKCSNSGSGFYVDAKNVNLPKLTINRDVMLEGATKKTNAVTIVLTPELSEDKTAFRYVIKNNVVYTYSKARTKKAFDYIDVDIQIQVKSITFAKDKYEVADLRTTTLTIPMVGVGSGYQVIAGESITSGWIPLLPKSSVSQKLLGKTPPDISIKTVRKETKTAKAPTDETTIETTTVNDQSKLSEVDLTKNAGQYEIEVTIVETNPYKIKAEYKNELIESTSETGTALLKTVIETVLKEEEEPSKEKE